MKKLIQFGETVDGYDIPVLNEREIRAAAGLFFLATYTALLFILLSGNFLLIKYVISCFLLDFLIRVLVNPRFSPSLIIGRMIVRGQTPEYVGAQQKKFAWSIGIVLSATMFVLMVLLNSYSPISGIICLICLAFLFFESVFGICLGCKFYPLIYRRRPVVCPGEVCERRSRQAIQRVSVGQLVVLTVFVATVVVSARLLNDEFSRKAHYLFQEVNTAKTR
jgi:hypothetical protein